MATSASGPVDGGFDPAGLASLGRLIDGLGSEGPSAGTGSRAERLLRSGSGSTTSDKSQDFNHVGPIVFSN